MACLKHAPILDHELLCCSSLLWKITMNQRRWEDAAGSCSLTAKYYYFIGKYGLIPAAHSGGEVNEHNSRKEQLQIWKKKEIQHGNTCGGIKLLVKHTVALFLLTKKGCALTNRGSKCLSRPLFSARAGKWFMLFKKLLCDVSNK